MRSFDIALAGMGQFCVLSSGELGADFVIDGHDVLLKKGLIALGRWLFGNLLDQPVRVELPKNHVLHERVVTCC